MSDTVRSAMFAFNKKREFREFTSETPLTALLPFFDLHSAAVVTDNVAGVRQVRHVVTKIDLVAFLAAMQ
jgi:cystathionine beta-synthase